MAPAPLKLSATQARVALGETFRLALDTLRAHKMRSFLTLLGIILAVATLVGVMSVVSGLNLYISDKVANLGANAFVLKLQALFQDRAGSSCTPVTIQSSKNSFIASTVF